MSNATDDGIRITGMKQTGVNDGFVHFNATADVSAFEASLDAMAGPIQALVAAMRGLPSELRADAEVVVRVGSDAWAIGEGAAIANMVEDYGRLTVRRLDAPATETRAIMRPILNRVLRDATAATTAEKAIVDIAAAIGLEPVFETGPPIAQPGKVVATEEIDGEIRRLTAEDFRG